jgi:hypothetical protein
MQFTKQEVYQIREKYKMPCKMSRFVKKIVILCSHDKREVRRNMKHKEKQENLLASEQRLGGGLITNK